MKEHTDFRESPRKSRLRRKLTINHQHLSVYFKFWDWNFVANMSVMRIPLLPIFISSSQSTLDCGFFVLAGSNSTILLLIPRFSSHNRIGTLLSATLARSGSKLLYEHTVAQKCYIARSLAQKCYISTQ